jgi:hypothetical protein
MHGQLNVKVVRMYRRIIALLFVEHRVFPANSEDVLRSGGSNPDIIHAVITRRLTSLMSCRLRPLCLRQQKLEYPVNTNFVAPKFGYNNNNNKLRLGCHPVAVVILHIYII